MYDVQRTWSVPVEPPAAPVPAAPMRPEELTLVVEGLRSEANGPGTWETKGYSREKLAELLLRLGGARGLGHSVVPVSDDDLRGLMKVWHSLDLYQRNVNLAARFGAIVAVLTTRLGQARTSGCWAMHGAAGLQWCEEPAWADFAWTVGE